VLQGAAMLALAPLGLATRANAEETTPQFQAAFKALAGDGTPSDGPVKLEMPELAENGNMVPFTISVESPMTDDNHVKTLTIFSTGNPQPIIAKFHFSPNSGRVLVSGRMRLARTQDVIAVAHLSTGALIKGATKVSVNVGGCGAG
jgi:sulfur-oxidizing protein SoxY